MYNAPNDFYRKGYIYTQLIHYMNEGVWIGDKDERTVYANPKFCSMLGYSLDEIIGKESYDFWDDESKVTVKNVNNGDRKEGKASSYEGFLMTRHGKKIPVLLSGAPLPDGGTIGIMTDLTEVKKGENTGRILSQAIEYAGDGIILLNKKGEIISWNKGAKKIFGYKKEEIEQKNISLLFPDLEESSFLEFEGEFMGLELIAEHKTEGKRIIQISIISLVSSDELGDASRLCIARDITALKKSEVELSSRYQKIKDAYEWLGKVQRQSDYLTDLIEITTKEYDQKKVLLTVSHGIIFLSGADACEIRLYNNEKNTLDLITHFGFAGNLRNFKSIPYHSSWGEVAYETNQPHYKIDLHDDKKIPVVKYYTQEDFKSAITIALRSKESVLGTITVLSKSENVFDLYENIFLQKYLKLVEIILNALR